jgi:hypothetical protein
VTGILSNVLSPRSGIVGLATGFVARGEIPESNGEGGGDGRAVDGVVTSIVGLAFIGRLVVMVLAVTFLGRAPR